MDVTGLIENAIGLFMMWSRTRLWLEDSVIAATLLGNEVEFPGPGNCETPILYPQLAIDVPQIPLHRAY